jgi:hypothetical protein
MDRDDPSDSEYGSDDSISTEFVGYQREMGRAMTNIFERIQLLYDFGLLLDCQSISGRFLKSSLAAANPCREYLPKTFPM